MALLKIVLFSDVSVACGWMGLGGLGKIFLSVKLLKSGLADGHLIRELNLHSKL